MSDFAPQFGWVPAPAEVAKVLATSPQPMFKGAAPHLKDSGKGQVALLYLAVYKVLGKDNYPFRKQTIGDCVSQGWAKALDYLTCLQIVLQGSDEEWRAKACSEFIYGASRVKVGGGRIWGDGSVGAWAAQTVAKFGSVVYGPDGAGFAEYDGSRSRQWGRQGPPDNLLSIASSRKMSPPTLCSSYEEARDAIAAGYPVPVASDQGFQMSRDKEGFATPRGSWPHQMIFVAVDDSYRRPGLLCDNSWGPNWIDGPTRNDQPPGSFWVDAEVADKMLRQGDSFVACDLPGFPNRDTSDWSWM